MKKTQMNYFLFLLAISVMATLPSNLLAQQAAQPGSSNFMGPMPEDNSNQNSVDKWANETTSPNGLYNYAMVETNTNTSSSEEKTTIAQPPVPTTTAGNAGAAAAQALSIQATGGSTSVNPTASVTPSAVPTTPNGNNGYNGYDQTGSVNGSAAVTPTGLTYRQHQDFEAVSDQGNGAFGQLKSIYDRGVSAFSDGMLGKQEVVVEPKSRGDHSLQK